jgi:hypothetical protein
VKTNFILTYTEVSLYRSCHRFPCVAIYILFYFASTVPALFLFYAAVPALFLFYAAIPAKIDYPIYSVFIAIYTLIYYYNNSFLTPHAKTLTPPDILAELAGMNFSFHLFDSNHFFFCPLWFSIIFFYFTPFIYIYMHFFLYICSLQLCLYVHYHHVLLSYHFFIYMFIITL